MYLWYFVVECMYVDFDTLECMYVGDFDTLFSRHNPLQVLPHGADPVAATGAALLHFAVQVLRNMGWLRLVGSLK